MRILVGSPDPALARALAKHTLEIESDVESFVRRAASERFDLLLAPDTVALERVRRSGTAVIVITRVGDVERRVRALESGADDAFDASFAPSQMAARVDAAVRRVAQIPRDPETLEIDGCTIDLDAGRAVRDGRSAVLSAREIDLVRWLHRHRSKIVSRAELLEHVWGVHPNNATRAVDVAVAALRAKIERDPRSPAVIVSVKGAGYRWGS